MVAVLLRGWNEIRSGPQRQNHMVQSELFGHFFEEVFVFSPFLILFRVSNLNINPN